MGYTTEFSGAIGLSRQLTIKEAKELMDLADADDADAVRDKTGVRTYMQWVPSETLDAIVWDGNEKFYEYHELLEWLCQTWLASKGIQANGRITYVGEDSSDVGELVVTNNRVAKRSFDQDIGSNVPLTSATLARMALDILTTEPK